MKNMLKFFSIFILSIVMFFSCTKPNNLPEENVPEENVPEEKVPEEKVPEVTYYKVMFYTDGGTDVDSQFIKSGTTANKPQDPEKEKYSFKGWFYNDKLFDFNTVITSNITLYAKWDKLFYVTFDLDNGTEVQTFSAIENEVLSGRPDNVNKEDYWLRGWFNGDEQFDLDKTKITSDISLKAKWYRYRVKNFCKALEFYNFDEKVCCVLKITDGKGYWENIEVYNRLNIHNKNTIIFRTNKFGGLKFEISFIDNDNDDPRVDDYVIGETCSTSYNSLYGEYSITGIGIGIDSDYQFQLDEKGRRRGIISITEW